MSKKVLKTVLPFGHEIDTASRSIVMRSPFSSLYFFLDEFKKYVKNDKSENAAPEDFEVLCKFYENHIRPTHSNIAAMVDSNVAQFGYLWAAYKPGELLYGLAGLGEPLPYIIGKSTYRGLDREIDLDIDPRGLM
jgi:hypothetical protein